MLWGDWNVCVIETPRSSLNKISCTRQFESKLSLRSFAKSLDKRRIFRKSPRPSFLIKRAALGNLKASFHCTHWHRFFPLKRAPPLISVFSPQGRRGKPPYSAIFAPPVFNSLYDPFGSPCRGQNPLREGP